MKKLVLVIVAIIAMKAAGAQDTATFWQKFSDVRYKNLSEVSYTLIHKRHFPEVEYVDTAYVEADTNAFVFLRNDGFSLKVSDDSLYLIDAECGNISYGPKEYQLPRPTSMNMYDYIRDHYQWDLLRYAPFYLHLSHTRLYAETDSVYEALDGGTPYHVMRQHLLRGYQYNEETKEYDIPVSDLIVVYCNDNTHWVDRVVVYPSDDTSYYTEFVFLDIRPNKRGRVGKDLFDLHAPQYKKYAKYDYVQAVAPSVIGIRSRDTTVTDKLLDFPLEGYNGDTTYLRQEKGWVLLEFWQYGCKPCVEFLNQLEQEKESLGYRRLEHAGVRIFCVNPKGGVTPTFKQHAERYHAQDILYGARGMFLLNIGYYPKYYLFSPSRELVFHGTTESAEDNIIDILLEAKQRYEAKQTGTNIRQ